MAKWWKNLKEKEAAEKIKKTGRTSASIHTRK